MVTLKPNEPKISVLSHAFYYIILHDEKFANYLPHFLFLFFFVFCFLEHNYNFRIGNVSLTLYDSGTEIFILTVTQLISSFQPNLLDKSFLLNVKIEALIVDGINTCGEEPLVTLISSQHLHNSPAYFFKFNLQKTPLEENCDYRLNGVLESLEIVYNKVMDDDNN